MPPGLVRFVQVLADRIYERSAQLKVRPGPKACFRRAEVLLLCQPGPAPERDVLLRIIDVLFATDDKEGEQ